MTDAEEIVETLRRHRPELEAMGVRHASLFGSRARGDERANSDIDIAVRFAPEAIGKGLKYFGLRADVEERLESFFDGTVEISDESMMRERIRHGFERDRIDAF